MWKRLTSGLQSDAKLLAGLLECAKRNSAGSWSLMLVECEIAAVRAWAGAAILAKNQDDGDALIQEFEARFRAWLEAKHQPALSTYSAFTKQAPEAVLDSLSTVWRYYQTIANSGSETATEDLILLFLGRCIEAYTARTLDFFVTKNGDQITDFDQFIPRYMRVQIFSMNELGKP
jgi:hypothetical protein